MLRVSLKDNDGEEETTDQSLVSFLLKVEAKSKSP